MTVQLERSITQDLTEAARREWLETNGLGGWAGSTVSGANTRRYHGLLVAATRPPVGRMVLLSKLDETLVRGDRRYELSCNFYPNTVHPRGYDYLQGFSREYFPRFDYLAGEIRIRKTVAAVHGENTTLVLYEVLEAPSPFVLELRPLVAARDYHALMSANDWIRKEGDFRDGLFRVRPYDDVPETFILVPGADFQAEPQWYYNFEYPAERRRGLDFREDLFHYGTFRLSLEAGQKVGVIVSTADPSGRDPFSLQEQERKRREALLHFLPRRDDFTATLALAADQFLVRRSENLCTIIAGYPWFTDWGRDTMIALPGIALATGRHEEARKILRAFAGSVSRGMIPNRFPDKGETPDFNTVDATLWFFVAAYHYLECTGDREFIEGELLPVLREIIAWHEKGTRYQIRVAEDGLLSAGTPGVQLTWMDAKVGEWVVTPRQGKAVEINALWYNALRITAHFLQLSGSMQEAGEFKRRADSVRKRFNRVFWNPESRCLYDYVDGEHREAAVRPNAIFAVSLPFPLLPPEQSEAVLSVVQEKLLTPFGLRSLDPGHPDYRPRCEGDPVARDGAYHQGTVWLWLLGPFIEALVRVKGEGGRSEARKMLEKLAGHLSDAGIGTLSEIFDGEPPHEPRGCIAQAWSVGEILRAWVDLGRLKND